MRRRVSRGPPLRHRARLGLGAHRRPRVGAGRAQDRVARRAEARRHARDGGRAVPRDVRHRLVVNARLDGGRAPARSAPIRVVQLLPLDAHLRARCWRAWRTTMFVFPLVSDARRRTLVKRWSARLLRILKVEARVRRRARRAARQRAGRRQSHLVARHLRAQRAPSGALRRQVGDRALAGRVADDPRRRHGVHRARAAARHAPRESARWRSVLARRRRRRDLSRRHDHGRHATCCRSRARSCSRSSRRRVMCSRWRSAIATPDGEHRARPPTWATRRSCESFWASAASAR